MSLFLIENWASCLFSDNFNFAFSMNEWYPCPFSQLFILRNTWVTLSDCQCSLITDQRISSIGHWTIVSKLWVLLKLISKTIILSILSSAILWFPGNAKDNLFMQILVKDLPCVHHFSGFWEELKKHDLHPGNLQYGK